MTSEKKSEEKCGKSILYDKKKLLFEAAFFIYSLKILVGIVIEVALDEDNGCTLVT